VPASDERFATYERLTHRDAAPSLSHISARPPVGARTDSLVAIAMARPAPAGEQKQSRRAQAATYRAAWQ
jgi:hypothetical protein